MSALVLPLTALDTALALVSLGGGLYEFGTVDPAWPRRPDLIQPVRGGISRKRFWIPAHISFEVIFIATIAVAWPVPDVRFWLLVALTSHVTMRIWSAVDFIPKAVAFEKAKPGPKTESAARRWVRRSLLRLPLDLLTCGAMLVATVAAARIG